MHDALARCSRDNGTRTQWNLTGSTEAILRLINTQDNWSRLPWSARYPTSPKQLKSCPCAEEWRVAFCISDAGTSGRLGVVDASECPDVRTDPEWSAASSPGGNRHVQSQEGQKDIRRPARCGWPGCQCPGRCLRDCGEPENPFVVSAVNGREAGGEDNLHHHESVGIDSRSMWQSARVGAEVLMGSTRMNQGQPRSSSQHATTKQW